MTRGKDVGPSDVVGRLARRGHVLAGRRGTDLEIAAQAVGQRDVPRRRRADPSSSEWHGFALWDLIFPLFIFIVGVSMSFSLPKRLERDGRWVVYRHVLIRAIILTVLGLVFWGTPGGVHPTWGYYSVLYRIAVSYLFAALILMNFRPTGQTIWAFGLIAGYWAVMRFVRFPVTGPGISRRKAP